MNYVLKYALKALGAAALAAAIGPGASAEEGVAPFAHAAFGGQLVAQAQGLQRTDDAQKLAHAGGADAPVDRARLVAEADGHGVAARMGVGLGLDGGQYVLIVGAWRCAIDELCLHGKFSEKDVVALKYAAKYSHAADQELRGRRVRGLDFSPAATGDTTGDKPAGH